MEKDDKIAQLEEKIAQLEQLEEKIAQLEQKVVVLEEKVVVLEEKTGISQEKISARAAELLASTGHSAPVSLTGDINGAPLSHLKAMAKLAPLDAAEYFALHKAEILSDKNRYAV